MGDLAGGIYCEIWVLGHHAAKESNISSFRGTPEILCHLLASLIHFLSLFSDSTQFIPMAKQSLFHPLNLILTQIQQYCCLFLILLIQLAYEISYKGWHNSLYFLGFLARIC